MALKIDRRPKQIMESGGKVCLVVIDGWGYNRDEATKDAINESECHHMRMLSARHTSYLVSAHGSCVGLLPGLMGNSEVGHLTIGSGRIVEQDVLRIHNAIGKGMMRDIVSRTMPDPGRRVHLVGMLSNGGVHSHIEHLKALLEALKSGDAKAYIHCISDGRDTQPRIFLAFYEEIRKYIEEIKFGEVASVAGRFYTMDRAGNLDRTERSFSMMTRGRAIDTAPEAHVAAMYGRGLSDETLEPFLIDKDGLVQTEDKVVFFNFRADRMRQIVERFMETGHEVYTMTNYRDDFRARVIFEKLKVRNTLAEVLAANGIGQVHIAESEKYAHVTYFFNGGREEPFPGERRIVLPSPEVRSYDAKPGMSSAEVTDAAVRELESGTPFVLVNLAPPDMIGHTGNFEAAKEAVRATDACIGRIHEACGRSGHILVVTADHGNAERMEDGSGARCKTHTTNDVPLIVCRDGGEGDGGSWGYMDSVYSLQDVAPTVLDLMGVEKPPEMTGVSVLAKRQRAP
jgi:2,3-bisphosphoglycerate-independent phosphoglycerate mutase